MAVGAFSAVTDRIPNAQTNVTGGISVEKGETQTAIDVTVVVEYGASIVEVGNTAWKAGASSMSPFKVASFSATE